MSPQATVWCRKILVLASVKVQMTSTSVAWVYLWVEEDLLYTDMCQAFRFVARFFMWWKEDSYAQP